MEDVAEESIEDNNSWMDGDGQKEVRETEAQIAADGKRNTYSAEPNAFKPSQKTSRSPIGPRLQPQQHSKVQQGGGKPEKKKAKTIERLSR